MKTIVKLQGILTLMAIAILNNPTSILANNHVDYSDCPKNAAHCEGTRTWKDGTVYEGEFRFGEPEGYGTMTWADGSSYEGEFREGVRHGKGIQKNDDESVYKGDFVDGFMHGQGAYHFACGHEYVGEFYKDNMDGNGSIQFANGTAYTGKWKMGKPHGEGKFLRADGSTITTTFNKGQRDGEGSISYEGNQLNGSWKNNKLNGESTIQFANGDQMICSWKKGALAKGVVTYISQDGSSAKKSIEDLLANPSSTLNAAWVIYLDAKELKTNGQDKQAMVRFQIAKRYCAKKSALQNHIRTAINELK